MSPIQVAAPDQCTVSQFVADQAAGFLDLFRRAPADLDGIFLRWAESKDFQPKDRRAIKGEVGRLLSLRGGEGLR